MPANANSLVNTTPISGSTVTIAPSFVIVTSQAALVLDGNEVIVTDSSGNRVDDGTITIDGMSASVGMKPIVDAGLYTVSYLLFAEGEDALEGRFTFNFSAPSVITIPDPVVASEPTKSASSSFDTNVFVIGMLVLAFFILIGLSLYARKLFKNRYLASLAKRDEKGK